MAKASMKTIKRRIKSVGSTLQITKAMEMVATSKLRRAKAQARASRPYFTALSDMLSAIASEKTDFSTVFTRKREVKNRLFIVIAGDRGLAGGYNSNILRLAAAAEKELDAPVKFIAIGKKAVDSYKRAGREVIAEFPYFAETAKASRCADISNLATELFKSGEVDEVRVFYTAFISALQQDARGLLMLPFEVKPVGEDGNLPETAPHAATHYDPSPEAVFDRVIPKLLLSVINGACVESFASEQVARRNAMENASDNAEEMIDNLSLQYNRARQEKITNEINEIVGGANAIS